MRSQTGGVSARVLDREARLAGGGNCAWRTAMIFHAGVAARVPRVERRVPPCWCASPASRSSRILTWHPRRRCSPCPLSAGSGKRPSMVGRWRLPRQRPAPAAKKRRGVTARFPRVERWVGVDFELASLITPFPFRSERNPTIPEGLDSRERRTGRRTVLKALDPA